MKRIIVGSGLILVNLVVDSFYIGNADWYIILANLMLWGVVGGLLIYYGIKSLRNNPASKTQS